MATNDDVLNAVGDLKKSVDRSLPGMYIDVAALKAVSQHVLMAGYR